MTYYDKQGNEMGLIPWSLLHGDADAVIADDTIDGFRVLTRYWGLAPLSQLYRSFVFDHDGEEVDGAGYPTEPVALQGHHDLCETLREMALDGGRPQ